LISFKTFILLRESLGTDITKQFLKLFSEFPINISKDNKTIHFTVDPIDVDGVFEYMKQFFKKQDGKQRKPEVGQDQSWILGTTLIDIFKPKKIGRKIQFDVVFN